MYMLFHHKVLMSTMIIMSLLWPVLSINDPTMVKQSIGVRVFSFVLYTTFMWFVMVVLNVILQWILLFLQKNRGVVGDHEFEIRDDGLVERTAFNESLHKWSGFHKVAGTSKYLVIYVTENNLHYIPLHAFATPQHAANFRAELIRHWHAARR
jgi:hypothetical protein